MSSLVAVACFLPGRAKDLSATPRNLLVLRLGVIVIKRRCHLIIIKKSFGVNILAYKMVIVSTVQQTPGARAPVRPCDGTTFRALTWKIRGSRAWNSLHANLLAPINLKRLLHF